MTWEIRIYIWLFLIICGALSFGVLRIYNAVRVNSGYMLRLKEQLRLFSAVYKKAAVSFAKSANKVSSAVTALNNSLKKNDNA
jgi:hypothetical protein